MPDFDEAHYKRFLEKVINVWASENWQLSGNIPTLVQLVMLDDAYAAKLDEIRALHSHLNILCAQRDEMISRIKKLSPRVRVAVLAEVLEAERPGYPIPSIYDREPGRHKTRKRKPKDPPAE